MACSEVKLSPNAATRLPLVDFCLFGVFFLKKLTKNSFNSLLFSWLQVELVLFDDDG